MIDVILEGKLRRHAKRVVETIRLSHGEPLDLPAGKMLAHPLFCGKQFYARARVADGQIVVEYRAGINTWYPGENFAHIPIPPCCSFSFPVVES